MGSISKRPVAPSVSTVTPTIPTLTPTTPVAESDNKSVEASVIEQREEGLLRRNRGYLGTILTGFQGVLSDTQNKARKTLLGE